MCADLLDLVPRAAQRDENLPAALKEIEAAAAAARRRGGRRQRQAEASIPAASRKPRPAATASLARALQNELRRTGGSFIISTPTSAMPVSASWPKGKSEQGAAPGTPTAPTSSSKPRRRRQLDARKRPPSGRTPDTAFAVLFLLRSSKRSIEKAYGYGESTLVAGRGLPKETATVTVFRGKVLPVPQWTIGRRTAADLAASRRRRLRPRRLRPWTNCRRKEAEILAANTPSVLRRLVADRVAAGPPRRGQDHRQRRQPRPGPRPDLCPGRSRRGRGRPSLRCPAATHAAPGPRQRPGATDRSSAAATEIQHWKQWYLAIRPEAEFDN